MGSNRSDSQFKEDAANAAERIERARETGEQLTFLRTADGGALVEAEAPRGPGRPKGSKNKTDGKLRDMLAAKGFRMPEDVLAEIAGLSSREDVLVLAMQRTEQLLAWAGDGAQRQLWDGSAHKLIPYEATATERLETFIRLYTAQINALTAMLPYGLAKVTPDESKVVAAVQINLPGAVQAQGARVVGASDLAPPPMPEETKQKQQVINAEPAQSDAEGRTQ